MLEKKIQTTVLIGFVLIFSGAISLTLFLGNVFTFQVSFWQLIVGVILCASGYLLWDYAAKKEESGQWNDLV
jgi:drug/metabolite transporter (DMT)-like permease